MTPTNQSFQLEFRFLLISSLLLLTFPSVSGSAIPRFVAVSFSSDGTTVLGANVEYSSVFGDSGTRNTESEVLTPVTFSHSITNFTVMAGSANCGSLSVGETVTVILRVNQVDSSLTGTCSGGASAFSTTIDSDTLTVSTGDRLSISFMLSGTILTRSINLGITAEGIDSQYGDKVGDPLKVFVSPVISNPGEQVLVDISESFFDGAARTGNANGTFINVYDGLGVLVLSAQNPSEVGIGTYRYSFNLNSTSATGNWLVLVNTTDPTSGFQIGSSNVFFLEIDGDLEPVTAFETVTTTSALEFSALIGVIVLAILIWSRSTDYLVRFAMGLVCFVPGIIWLRLVVVASGTFVATFLAFLGLFALSIGVYLIVRLNLDTMKRKSVV